MKGDDALNHGHPYLQQHWEYKKYFLKKQLLSNKQNEFVRKLV